MVSRLLVFLILITAAGIDCLSQYASKPPNIIFILTDDQRWDALGYAGNSLVNTPEMDQLAEEGVYFKNALVTTPICAASRATILTGLYERTHGYNFMTGGIKDEFISSSYPKLLKEAGYHVGFFGKLGVRTTRENELFDSYEGYDRNMAHSDRRGYYYKTIHEDTVHLTRYTGEQAMDFIDSAPAEQPFCLSLSFSAPHAHDPATDQYFWQNETDQLLQGVTIPEPLLDDDKYFEKLPQEVRDGFNRTRWHWRYDTPEKYQHSVKGYYRMIAGIDLEIGKIRKKLEENGIADNTIIIVMGDNGYFMGERQLAGKWLLYDNSIRVPLIIYDPRNPLHRDVDHMAANVDIPSTILDFAGVKAPDSWQGNSLVPFTQVEESQTQDTVLIEHIWEFGNIPPSEGIRTKEWKYFRYVNDQSKEELYNLKKDPLETKNLALQKKHRDLLVKMRKKTDELIGRYQDPTVGKPTGLMVELIRKPESVAVVDPFPEYYWQVPEGAVKQMGYQILVASSKENIDRNIGDVWNSGEVRSGRSSNIEHQGTALKKGITYYWKVRLWGELNRLGSYSDAQAFTYSPASQNLITTANIFQVSHIKPVKINRTGSASFQVDFGKDAFATLALDYITKEADTLIVRLGEQLKDGKINTNPEGHIRYQEVKLLVSPEQRRYQIPLKADERNTLPAAIALPDSFPVLMPFRYCEIENAKTTITADHVTQLAYHTYFEDDQSHFISSDTILNQIWDLCKYSVKATSFAGLYVDGDRERIPYEADAYINQLSHYAVDREYPMARRTIEYLMKNPTWPTEWQLHMALMFYEDYMYTGNTELIEKYYEELKHKTLMELARPDGLISSEKATPEFMQRLGFQDPEAKLRDIIDWPPAQKDTGWKLATAEGERDGYVFRPINTVINSFYYKNMQVMAELAEALGKNGEAMNFRLLGLKVKNALNQNLFDEERGVYVDGEGTDHASLHANMMPLAFGLVPEEHVPSVVAFIKTRGMACSVYGAQYLLDGLYDAGEGDYALELMTATHDRSWWNMIAIGSTITLEAWDMKYKPNADWNHAWGAVPGNIIARKMWGIQPKTPGGSIVNIEPQLAKLSSSSIEVPLLNGVVKASYRKENERLQRYTFELPANISGELKLVYNPDDTVTLNGESVNMSFDTIRLSPGINTIELKVNSF